MLCFRGGGWMRDGLAWGALSVELFRCRWLASPSSSSDVSGGGLSSKPCWRSPRLSVVPPSMSLQRFVAWSTCRTPAICQLLVWGGVTDFVLGACPLLCIAWADVMSIFYSSVHRLACRIDLLGQRSRPGGSALVARKVQMGRSQARRRGIEALSPTYRGFAFVTDHGANSEQQLHEGQRRAVIAVRTSRLLATPVEERTSVGKTAIGRLDSKASGECRECEEPWQQATTDLEVCASMEKGFVQRILRNRIPAELSPGRVCLAAL